MASKFYFSYFPNVVIGDTTVKDIYSHYFFQKLFQDNSTLFKEYNVTDGETPETLAYKFYGDKAYFWIILMVNEIKDYFYDWPLSDNELRLLTDEYYNELSETGVTKDQIFEDLYNENEGKRVIKYLDPDRFSDFIYQAEQLAGAYNA